MIDVLRFVAPVLGACLLSTPALAQDAFGGAPVAPPIQAAYASPNRNLSRPETMWHLRSALNVAALACRGADGDETVHLYNAMLSSAKDALAEAAAGTEQAYRARFAAHWQDAEDAAMTRLYNFFASQPGHDGFCATAHDVLRDVGTVEPSSFADFAVAALQRLEAPFAAAYGAGPAPVERATVSTLASLPAPVEVAALGAVGPAAGPAMVSVAYRGPPQ